MLKFKFVFLLIAWVLSINTYAQQNDSRIDSILSLKSYIEQNISNPKIFTVIDIDGIKPTTIIKKKILGLFNKTISQTYGGSYSETDIIKDSALISARVWDRIYFDSQKSSSEMTFEEFIYDNDKLCYYYEIKKSKKKGESDSLIYKVEYFFNNGNIIKKSIKGKLDLEEKDYINKFKLLSNSLYNKTNEWIEQNK